jgi:predicted Kef-type K+ transport protein
LGKEKKFVRDKVWHELRPVDSTFAAVYFLTAALLHVLFPAIEASLTIAASLLVILVGLGIAVLIHHRQRHPVR